MSFAAKTAKKAYQEVTHIPGKALKEAKRGLFPSPTKVKMPELPEPSPLTVTLGVQKGAERRRLRRRRGKTVFAGGRAMGAAPVAQMGLLTKFGGR